MYFDLTFILYSSSIVMAEHNLLNYNLHDNNNNNSYNFELPISTQTDHLQQQQQQQQQRQQRKVTVVTKMIYRCYHSNFFYNRFP
jgi:hypothetical protein